MNSLLLHKHSHRKGRQLARVIGFFLIFIMTKHLNEITEYLIDTK